MTAMRKVHSRFKNRGADSAPSVRNRAKDTISCLLPMKNSSDAYFRHLRFQYDFYITTLGLKTELGNAMQL